MNIDIWILPADGDRTPKPLPADGFQRSPIKLSPDGNYVAYASDESGRYEIYVDSFPTPRGKYRATDTGALAPYWRNATIGNIRRGKST